MALYQNITTTNDDTGTKGLSLSDWNYWLSPNGTAYFPLLKWSPLLTSIYCLAYLLVFVCSSAGNVIVIVLMCRKDNVRSFTNLFITNLAIADILVAVLCVPIGLLSNIFSGWMYGAFLCKAVPYLMHVSVNASVNTLAAIAIDRYLAICKSFRRKFTSCTAKMTVAGIWIVACTLMTPNLIFYRTFEDRTKLQTIIQCNQIWPDYDSQRGYFVGTVFLACYILPLTIVAVCYVLIILRVWRRQAPGVDNTSGIIKRSRIKVAKMVAAVVIMFTLSWLPLHATFLVIYFGSLTVNSKHVEIIFQVVLPVAQWLGLANSGMNPFIYCFFSKKYRKGFLEILSCCCKSKKHRRHLSKTSSTKFMTVESTNGQAAFSTKTSNKHSLFSTIFL